MTVMYALETESKHIAYAHSQILYPICDLFSFGDIFYFPPSVPRTPQKRSMSSFLKWCDKYESCTVCSTQHTRGGAIICEIGDKSENNMPNTFKAL